MANALIVTELDIELAKARAKIDEFVKETEARTIRIGIDASSRKRSTLGGQVITGADPEPFNIAPQSSGNRFDMQGELQRRWMGGSNFGPAVRPVGTASQNTVYGDTHSGASFPALAGPSSVSGGASGSASFLASSGVAITGAIATVVLAGNQQLQAIQRQRDIQRYDSLSTAVADSASEQRGVLGTSRALGGAANSVLDAIDSALPRGASRAFNKGLGFAFGGATRFVDNNSVREAEDNVRRVAAAEISKQSGFSAVDIAAENTLVGSDGFGRAASALRIAQNIRNRQFNQSRIDNPFVNNFAEQGFADAGTESQIRDINVLARQGLRETGASARTNTYAGENNPLATQLSEADSRAQSRRFLLERSLQGADDTTKGILRGADDALAGSERGAITQNYHREAAIQTDAIRGRTSASARARTGDVFGAEAESAQVATRATLAGLPGFEQYQRDPTSVNPDDRARINAVIAGGREQQAVIAQAQFANRTSTGLQIQANAAALALNPLRAQELSLDADFAAKFAGQRADSEPVRKAEKILEQQKQLGRQQFAFGTLQVGIGLATQREELQASLARDPYSAEAIGISGGAISDAVSLFQNGRRGQARDRLRNGVLALQASAQDFGFSFEAEEGDAFNKYYGPGSRIFGDPQTTFDTYNGKANGLLALAGSSDQNFVSDAAGVGGAGGFKEVADGVTTIIDILKRRLDNDDD